MKPGKPTELGEIIGERGVCQVYREETLVHLNGIFRGLTGERLVWVLVKDLVEDVNVSVQAHVEEGDDHGHL